MDNQKKIELTLCGMLPYELKAEVKNWGAEQKKFTVKCLGLIGSEVIVESPYGNHDYIDFEDFKPLLHSLDKLTEPILDGGLIPIVELLKLAGYRNFDDYAHFNFTSLKLIINKNYLEFHHSNNKIVFEYEDGCFNLYKIEPTYEVFKVANQLELFEKLKEWHFNIYDLPKEMYIEKLESNGK